MSKTSQARGGPALQDKVALVTGGGAGIGAAIARAFSRAGAAVVVVDIDEAAGTAIVREITGAGGRALFVAGDVSRDEDCRRAVERTVDAFGALDVLVNNA
nr:SDR family NAD(P)-dependent oxidoreductase [Gemmatimonadota bacterium]NIR75039.1 SDR family NAD(P)-dependent oxidoreductase [Candidatus Kutchimonas denitrificans]NIS02859.1 SDR family NAD(P)-dependent oxidoreductase [Gemmatimonadota bacterium]NIT68564.1 SDR family NAD(P)-dependent oxidoreductase [Gemmatimonadota bacterium]NIU52809.1 SDR family NAD(P)-dependent oxidoreductase [Gemmatimonadota bacterium]